MIQSRFNNDFDQLLKETPKEIAIAVSGGVDSIALLHLVSSWADSSDTKLSILSVNHNLRSEARDEIRYVEKISRELGHKFFALSWDCGGTKIALQQRARQGRYNLMSAKCCELGITTLLTAHHLDDMLETYLMRKSKKSGVFGLSYSNSFFHNNIQILRPLLNISKAELIKYLQNQNIKWLEDISNSSDLYERNRIRKQIALFTDTQKSELLGEMQAGRQRAAKLGKQLIAIMAESLQINNYGFAKLDLKKLKNACLEIQIQILNYIVTIISGKTTLPRFRSTRKLLSKLEFGENIKCSLHGCILKEIDGALLVFREKAAISVATQQLGSFQYWDNRFDILFDECSTGYYVDRLGFADYIAIKDQLNLDDLAKISDNNHKLILFTLPVIKNLEKVVAIPHISYYDDFDHGAIVKVVFRPSFISRFTHFL